MAAAIVPAALLIPGTSYAALPDQPAQTWGTNGRVDVILPVGDQVVLGGSFSAVVDPSGKSYPASNIAVVSASTGAVDLSWQGSADKQVTGLAALGGKLYVGGSFSKVDGVGRKKLAALDLATGALDPAWTPSTSAPVDAMAAANGSVYVSGLFTTVTDAAGVHNRAYVAKLDATTGALDTGWTPSPNDRTRALLVSTDGGTVYLGGDFTSVSGLGGTNKLAAVSATGSGAVITAFRSGPNNGSSIAPIYDLATDGTNVYEAVGGGGGACTGVNGATGAQLWSKHTTGNLHGVRYSGGVVYCGGHFSGSGSFDGQTRFKLAAVSATAPYATTSFAPRVNSALGVWALGSDATRLFVGGDFTKITKVSTQHYAEFVEGGAQTVPSAPTLSATPGNNVVHLSWAPPASDGGSPILRYAVYRKTAGATKYGRPIAKVGSGTTYDDTGVSNGTAYAYEVAAINALGTGAMSNEVAATPGTGTSYTDSSVTAGATYYYTVTAVNAIGEGPASNEASTAASASVPSAPVLTATVASGVVHLSWTAPTSDGGSPVTKYLVVRDGVRLMTVKAGTLAFDDNTVTSGKSYTYQVRAHNDVGNSKYSNRVTVSVP